MLPFTVPIKIIYGLKFLHLSAERLSARGLSRMCVCLKYATIPVLLNETTISVVSHYRNKKGEMQNTVLTGQVHFQYPKAAILKL